MGSAHLFVTYSVLRWFDAMDTREVYRGAKSDYYTHCHDLPPQIGGCRVEAEGVPFKDEIDGKDGERLRSKI